MPYHYIFEPLTSSRLARSSIAAVDYSMYYTYEDDRRRNWAIEQSAAGDWSNLAPNRSIGVFLATTLSHTSASPSPDLRQELLISPTKRRAEEKQRQFTHWASFDLADFENMSYVRYPTTSLPHKRRSNVSSSSSTYPHGPSASTRNNYTLSRRSSQSSIRTVATGHSVGSTATSTSICSAKFERAWASQLQKWSTSSLGHGRRASLSSTYSSTSIRTTPPRPAGIRNHLQKQLETVENLLRANPENLTETGSTGWLLIHERHQLRTALKFDERANSEWDAALDWQTSAQEGPVSKIFVTHRSKYGLTPEQHRYRLGQASTLGNNALDLWRFSDDAYKEACDFRRIREEQNNELTTGQQQRHSGSSKNEDLIDNAEGAETPIVAKDAAKKKDFQTWLREVSKNGGEALHGVKVKDDGTVERSVASKQKSSLIEVSLREGIQSLALVEETEDDAKHDDGK